jgi:hypothetical protein
MSTRGLYTFKGASQRDSWNVYKHSDNYPTGAAEAITLALSYAWELPRYEADEFSTAFIAANKSGPGGVRLMPQGKPLAVAQKNCADIDYRYEIYMVGKGRCADLHVKAFSIDYEGPGFSNLTEKLIYVGNLAGFAAWPKHEEEKEAEAI